MTPEETVEAITREHGDWMTSEAGLQGVHDMVWSIHPTFKLMNKADQGIFFSQVLKAMGWENET